MCKAQDNSRPVASLWRVRGALRSGSGGQEVTALRARGRPDRAGRGRGLGGGVPALGERGGAPDRRALLRWRPRPSRGAAGAAGAGGRPGGGSSLRHPAARPLPPHRRRAPGRPAPLGAAWSRRAQRPREALVLRAGPSARPTRPPAPCEPPRTAAPGHVSMDIRQHEWLSASPHEGFEQMRLKSRPKEPSPSLTRVGANFYSSVKQQDYSASVWLRRKDKLEHVRAARPGASAHPARPSCTRASPELARACRDPAVARPGHKGVRALRPTRAPPALSRRQGPESRGGGREGGSSRGRRARTPTSARRLAVGRFAPSLGACAGRARSGTAASAAPRNPA